MDEKILSLNLKAKNSLLILEFQEKKNYFPLLFNSISFFKSKKYKYLQKIILDFQEKDDVKSL